MNFSFSSAFRALSCHRSSGLAFTALSATLLLIPVPKPRAGHPVTGSDVPAAAHPQTIETLTSPVAAAKVTAPAKNVKYELKLHHLHTGESLDIVYRVGDVYLPGAMNKLNHFLRDHRTEDTAHYDPKEFDLLHSLMAKMGKANDTIDVICGYRTPWSNNFLRTRGGTASPVVTGVAKNSQHMQSKAIDIRVPGVSTSKLRETALSLHGGGVGYYPVSQFVHVDVGPVRQWTFAGRGDD